MLTDSIDVTFCEPAKGSLHWGIAVIENIGNICLVTQQMKPYLIWTLAKIGKNLI